jgi:hypothetical protein
LAVWAILMPPSQTPSPGLEGVNVKAGANAGFHRVVPPVLMLGARKVFGVW